MPDPGAIRAPRFADLGLPVPLVQALRRTGLETAFPIQAAAIPDILAGRDVLGRAATGSGKTLAFGLPMLVRLTRGASAPRHPRGLILAPTRELALQIATALDEPALALGLRLGTAVGGVPIARQVQRLARGVDLLIATPGRLADLIAQGAAGLDAIRVATVDEADHMAQLGFLDQVTTLLDRLPPESQHLLFSATLDDAVDVLVQRYLHDPVLHAVDAGAPNTPARLSNMPVPQGDAVSGHSVTGIADSGRNESASTSSANASGATATNTPGTATPGATATNTPITTTANAPGTTPADTPVTTTANASAAPPANVSGSASANALDGGAAGADSARAAGSNPGVTHHLLHLRKADKRTVITEIAARDGRTLLFVRTQYGADKLARRLRESGVAAAVLHGGRTQNQRTRTLAAFADGSAPVLVATDVAARGIHVDDISLVVHVDPPTDPKDYLHRAGRTARAGASGTVVTLVTDDDRETTAQLLRTAGIRPSHTRIRPGDRDLTNLTGARRPSGTPVPDPAAPPPNPRTAPAPAHRRTRTGRSYSTRRNRHPR